MNATKTKRTIIIYIPRMHIIGGAETWIYNLTNILKDQFEIKLLYEWADSQQLSRLQVLSEKRDCMGVYYCDILLNVFYSTPVNIRAKHTIQTVHNNHKEQSGWDSIRVWDRIDSYVFASQAAKDAFPISINKPSKILRNPVCDAPEKPQVMRTDSFLHLMAATRLTAEKGGSRLIKLCHILEESEIDFDFRIWTDKKEPELTRILGRLPKQIKLLPPQLNLYKEMANSDYVVQLSDCEAFCYTIHEALQVKTPVIVTDWKGVRESVKDGKNGYILNMDLSDFRPEDLLKRPNEFPKLKTSNQDWINYLQNIELFDNRWARFGKR